MKKKFLVEWIENWNDEQFEAFAPIIAGMLTSEEIADLLIRNDFFGSMSMAFDVPDSINHSDI